MKWTVACHVVVSLAGFTSAAEVTPIGKVVQMLKDMKSKGEKDMQEEQVQYAAFEQFCESTATEKQRSIDEAKDLVEVLEAKIEKGDADASKLSDEIAGHIADIESATTEKQNATKVRAADREDFAAMLKDYTESINAIGKALRELKANKGTLQGSLVQLKSLQLPAKASTKLHALLAEGYELKQGSAPNASDAVDEYEFQSDGVIGMLEKLEDKFVDERVKLEKEEVGKKHSYDLMALSLDDKMEQSTKEKEQKTTFKAKALEDKASSESDLAEAQAGLKADTEYAADLSSTCKQKAVDYKERQKLRKEELEAIGKTIEIVSSPAVSGTSLMQKSARQASALAKMNAEGKSPVQAEVARFLQRQANQLNSRVLSNLAQRASTDGLGRVKEMIQALVTRMQNAADEETTQKGYCDKELKTNKATREEKTDAVTSLQAEVDELNATIGKLGEDAAKFTSEVSEMTETMNNATELRHKEKVKNNATIKDAKQAQEAVAQAITVLKDFYAKAGQTSLVQKDARSAPVPAKAPKVFGDESYKGMQDAQGGVVSMLEVIQSDFSRIEAETSAEEAAAAKEYEKFMEESKLDKAVKSKEIEHKKSKRQEKASQIVTLQEDLQNTQKELDAAMAYFETLKPKCLDAGVSYEERKARREEEIKQMQEALAMLENAS
eukprot:TRINITY_DN4162_c0_g2_i1.p1 TRINITY_DN4162_c0_g2~~TRINITY_DN4162_c0_g2_i1.p1  ORF type:complete len:668 (-),score=232.75 TRINITY_DN4162_c0_g2_i1:48-2051(-)